MEDRPFTLHDHPFANSDDLTDEEREHEYECLEDMERRMLEWERERERADASEQF